MTHQEPLAAGWLAELVTGSRQVVVRGPTPIDEYRDAVSEAHAAAQEALDVLSMRAIGNHVIEGADSRHVVWWETGGNVVCRIVGLSDVGVSMSGTATVTRSDGTVVPPQPPPALIWHESLRYFRLSQTTSDLFDAYRNMYLALESLLSAVVPQLLSSSGKPAEGEGMWLKRALTHVDTILPLGSYVPPGSTSPIDDVFVDLYAGTRTGIFHSKSGRPVMLPHGAVTREGVVNSLERLSRIYLDLFDRHLGFRRPAGAMTYAGFAMMTGYDAVALVSDDPSPEDKSDSAMNPRGGGVVRLTTRRAPDLSEPGHTFWLGEASKSDVPPDVIVVRRVGLEQDRTLVLVDRLDDPLSLAGVDVLQVQEGLRLVNRQLPRFRFQT